MSPTLPLQTLKFRLLLVVGAEVIVETEERGAAEISPEVERALLQQIKILHQHLIINHTKKAKSIQTCLPQRAGRARSTGKKAGELRTAATH